MKVQGYDPVFNKNIRQRKLKFALPDIFIEDRIISLNLHVYII